MNEYNEIRKQIKKTINELELNLDEDSKKNIFVKYKYVHEAIEAKGALDLKLLRSLLDRSRGYLETSSNWDQRFLYEMGITEKMILELLRSITKPE